MTEKAPLAFWRKTIKGFHELTGGQISETLDSLVLDRQRAYASSDRKLVNVGEEESEETYKAILWHEMGHHIEYNNESVRQAARDLIIRRATGSPISLNELDGTTAYRTNEIVYPDKFVSSYVGKDYPMDSTGRTFTEVIAMGVERLATPDAAAQFYRKDKEHFLFTIGALLRD